MHQPGRRAGLPASAPDQVTDQAVFTRVLVMAGVALLLAVALLAVSFALDEATAAPVTDRSF
jgi:hypothetical protein